MYATCMFCNRPLGTNGVVESFPVGRRLAFDAHRGRLWVVCGKCERWNLSPLEERWEAVETLERLFRDTRIRVSTEHIGLARHPEGLEMVRIGEPLRPEFAAWRYGDQFGRRRRRAILYGVGGAAVLGTLAIGGVVTGAISGTILSQSGNWVNIFLSARTLAKVRLEDGKVLKLRRSDLQGTRLELVDGGWDLVIRTMRRREHRFTGEEASRVAGLVISRINASGARKGTVQDAVRRLDQLGSPEAVLRAAATEANHTGFRRSIGNLSRVSAPTRLAVEMALHEEEERRALAGELWLLERRWKEAEEIAAISDDLLLPEGTQEFLARHRTEGAVPPAGS